MDCGVITSKTVLLFLSLIFWVIAGVLSYVGTYVILSYKNYNHFIEDKYVVVPAVVIIGVAIVMFIIGLLGCCATLRESRLGLGCFLFIILCIFVGEVTAFVLGVIYRGKIGPDLTKGMSGVFQKYDGHNAESRAVDYLQKELQCCGVDNLTDWKKTEWFKQGNGTVPVSCCKLSFSNCTGNVSHMEDLNTQGCKEKLADFFQRVLSYALLVILGFALVELFGMLSVCVITCKRRDNDQYGYEPLNSGTVA